VCLFCRVPLDPMIVLLFFASQHLFTTKHEGSRGSVAWRHLFLGDARTTWWASS